MEADLSVAERALSPDDLVEDDSDLPDVEPPAPPPEALGPGLKGVPPRQEEGPEDDRPPPDPRPAGIVANWYQRHQFVLVWGARRAITGVAQLLAVIAILYVFFYVLPPSSVAMSPLGYLTSWWQLVVNLFTGQWGTITVGVGYSISTYTYASYFLPYSIELGVLAIALSFLVAYPIGLLSGWKKGRVLDWFTQGYVSVWLVVPTVALCLVLIVSLYTPFLQYTGDFTNSVEGTLPSAFWFDQYMGTFKPSWVGLFGQTSPTGFPLLDAAWNHAWGAAWIILLKLLIDAGVIALTYTAVFLRFARNSTVEVVRSPHLRVGRAMGISEGTLLWRHAGRRVLPLYIFTLGNTFGAYLVIQSIVEFLFDTNGALYLLLYNAGQGLITGGVRSEQALIIALIFLIAVAILVVNVVAEMVAMALDPTWAPTGAGEKHR